MGFDKDDPRPLVQPRKSTTQVNFAVVAGVAIFFIVCALAIVWMKMQHPE